MEPIDIFAFVIGNIMRLVAIVVAVYFFYHAMRAWRDRNKPGEHMNIGPIYGAWQGHNLGTTTLDPGELTEIEKELGIPPPEPRM